jgi:hypothetical protein
MSFIDRSVDCSPIVTATLKVPSDIASLHYSVHRLVVDLFIHQECHILGLRRVTLIRTNVSEEDIASIIRVTKIGELTNN